MESSIKNMVMDTISIIGMFFRCRNFIVCLILKIGGYYENQA
jgi:hypothetical protein